MVGGLVGAGQGGGGCVAITAVHGERGRLDASLEDLGCGWAWGAVHRARPRVPLACPECGHGMHAKVSRHRLRFFAHDPGAPDCALSGESMEHHLLKLELASAVRAAGFHAELEVRGPGGDWRADVMASSPDGTVRMAWEAQLSPITAEEVARRTARFAKDAVRVCWVATKLRPWVGAVPSVHVRPPGEERAGWTVAGGLVRFTVEKCDECLLGRTLGHGRWQQATADLRSFVGWVLAGRAVAHPVPGGLDIEGHRWAGVWSADRYIRADADHSRERHRLLAEWEEQSRRREADRRRGLARQRAAAAATAPAQAARQPTAPDGPVAEPRWVVDLPSGERERLHAAAVSQALVLDGVHAVLRHRDGDRRWALGTAMFVGGRPYGVLRPRPRFVDWSRLAGLVIFVRNRDELRLLGRTAPNGARIVVLPGAAR
ncbi:competence protein CoiA [Kitasatospora sp. NPDC057015]|uniref:competence protein CoiA n=1 Tax=Kitasatospora sp. NPDC057015 TaxID=3346001 RepID=UPI00363116C8